MAKKIKKYIYKLLKKSEKFMKTDMIYLAKGGFWLSFSQVIVSIIGVGVAIAFANLLPKEVYGTYRFAISIADILVIAALPGLNGALTQAISRGYEEYYKKATIQKIKFGLLGSLIAIIISTYYYINGNNELSLIFLISAFFIPFSNTFKVWVSLMVGRQNFKKVAYSQIFVRLFTGSSIIFILLLTNNIFLVIITFFLSNIIANLIVYIKTIIKAPPNEEYDEGVLKYGKNLTWITIIEQIATQLDKILIFHYLGSVEVAVYSIAKGPIEQIKGPMNNFSFILIPKLSVAKIDQIKRSIYIKLSRAHIIMIPLVLIYILIAPWFFKTFFPLYQEAIIYSQLLSLSLFLFPQTIIYSVLNAHKKIGQIYTVRIITSILKILLLFMLIIFYGVFGVIIAFIISEAINYITLIFVFKRIKI